MIKILTLLIAFVGDIVLASFLGGHRIMSPLSITPNLFLIALILVTYKERLFNSVITALLVGFTMDIFNRDVFLLNTVIYLATVLIVRGWSKIVNYSVIEIFITVLAAVFVKEILMYVYYTSFAGIQMRIDTFVLTHLTYTLLFNIVLILICSLIKKRVIDDDIYRQQRQGRRASIDNKY